MVAALLGWAVFIAAFLCIFILPWLTISRKTRTVAGIGYVAASFVFGGSLWIMCLLTVWDSWGLVWALAGVLILGIGALPMSLIIFAKAGLWWLFGEVLVIGAIAFGARVLGFWVIGKAK